MINSWAGSRLVRTAIVPSKDGDYTRKDDCASNRTEDFSHNAPTQAVVVLGRV